MKPPTLLVENCSNIILNIKVIGYASQGECIIFELVEQKVEPQLLYVGLIDSYSLKDCHVAKDYLDSIGIEKLDFICWTHPDNDHSKGLLDILKSFCSENTVIAVPGTLDKELNQVLDLSDGHEKILDYIDNHNFLYPNKMKLVIAGYGQKLEVIHLKDQFEHTVDFVITAIAPQGGEVRHWKINKKERVKNILSVGLVIELGKYKFILSGDMPDDSILAANEEYLYDPLWIKIPHHGSDSSKEMSSSITYDSKNLFGCTTVFKAHKLPYPHILDAYLDKGCERIDSTSTGKEKYGIVDYSFNLFDSQQVRITHIGNACKYEHS